MFALVAQNNTNPIMQDNGKNGYFVSLAVDMVVFFGNDYR